MNLITRYITKNPYFNDGRWLEGEDFKGFLLHDVACCQPDPLVFIRGWDDPSHTSAGINGFIGDRAVYVTAPCLETPGRVKRMPHACSPCNNHYIGFEQTNPATLKFNQNHTKFTVDPKDLPAAKAFVAALYRNAVELFAKLCLFHGKDPLEDGVILSHKEAGQRGIASQHGDPEGLWNGLNMGYTMDGFRADVKARMEEEINMTNEEVKQLILQTVGAEVASAQQALSEQFIAAVDAMREQLSEELGALRGDIRAEAQGVVDGAIDKALGPMIGHLKDAPKWMRPQLKELLEFGVINGGTPEDVDPLDVNKRRAILEAVLMGKACTERYVQSLLLPAADETGDAG